MFIVLLIVNRLQAVSEIMIQVIHDFPSLFLQQKVSLAEPSVTGRYSKERKFVSKFWHPLFEEKDQSSLKSV